MVAGWLVVPSGLIMLALSAWYGVNQYSASNAPDLPGADGRLRSRSGGGPGRCECALPASLRVVRMLHHVFPPPIQHRMGGDDVPDLSQLSTAELQQLLGLPPDLIPTEQEIAELQSLLQENGVPLSVLMQAGQQNKQHEEQADALDEASSPGDLHAAASDTHAPVAEGHAPPDHAPPPPPPPEPVHEPEEHHAPEPPHVPPPPPPEPHDPPGASPPAPPPVPFVPPSMMTGTFGVPFSQAAMDAAHDVFDGANVPIAAVSNPFPQHPFPADYADYGNQFLGPSAFPLSPTSYYHPVRTFKFRLFVPTFREFFGFQFASQTIVEIYVAKKPGANQFTGIPDAFFEKKYWNVLFEVDGNKVISTMPQVLGDQPIGRTSPGKEDIVAETEYNPTAGRYEPKADENSDYGYDSGGEESNGYGGGGGSDYGQGTSDYGYDSDGYSQDSEGYSQDSDQYGYDTDGYGYNTDGYGQKSGGDYEYESAGSEYGSDGYGSQWEQQADGQFSRRSGMPDAFRRKANQTPARASNRGQNHARRQPAANSASRQPARGGVNRMGVAAAATRTAQGRPKKRTSSNSKRRPAQSSRRPVPYGPSAQVPASSRQPAASSQRQTQSSSQYNSNRRASASTRRGTAPARTSAPQRRRSGAAAKSAPTPPGWQPPLATNYHSRWPEAVAADYEDNELRREAHRNQLKYKAKHGYMRRMSPERYTAWHSARQR